MLFIISSSPDTQEFKTALSLAKDSDLCLIHDAVYLTMEERSPVTGKVYAIKDDLSIRGITAPKIDGLKIIDHSELVDLMSQAEKVVGSF
ncbi:MAG: sulfurtransferase complex subunit TusB [Nitrospirae bacterium]|nr:sulfurtransferase complex subunit TusB [Nitrospirota bacterium]